MKRPVADYLHPFAFDEVTRAELRQLLPDCADAFLEAIAQEVSEYAALVKAEVPTQRLKEWRANIERVGREAAALAASLRWLDEDEDEDDRCARLLDEGYVLETHRLDSREMTVRRLDELARACARVAASRGLNPREGAPPDFDRRRLARACAAAYRRTTGKAPKTSPNGTFARVLLIVMRAGRAVPQTQTSISQEFLAAVLSTRRRRKVTRRAARQLPPIGAQKRKVTH